MIGVVGDDTTGALDIGVMFHRAGCGVQMFTTAPAEAWAPTDVTIIDTDSRLDNAGVAYEKVHAAARRLQVAGCTHFHKKTCSVFRGNIGAELDAMLDATGEKTAIIAGAYPLLGRTTRDGRHFLHGQPLEKTGFAHDPIHPRKTSDLVRIIGEQSRRPVGLAPLGVVRGGTEALRAHLDKMRQNHSYILVDGETQADLATLAGATTDFRAFGGSAGFAAEWPAFLPFGSRHGDVDVELPAVARGVLFVSGSLTPQTRMQTERLQSTGIATFEFDPSAMAPDAGLGQDWADAHGDRVAALIAGGRSVLVHTTQESARIQAGQQAALSEGLDVAAYGRGISSQLAALCARVLELTPVAGLVVAGGDTSGSVTRRLGITGCRILHELEPGVPLCVGFGRTEPLFVVFKSGSFGSRDFLIQTGRRLADLNHVTFS